MIHIRVFKDQQVIRDVVFQNDVISIGRSPDNHLILPDDSISWIHAIIEKQDHEWKLKDLSSLNGVRVNHTRIAEMSLKSLTTCFIGVFEIEIQTIPTGRTRLLKESEWQEINRRRGLSHHIFYTLSGAFLCLGYFLLKPAVWNKGDSYALGLLLSSIVSIPLAALILLIVYKALNRKVRLADTLELMRDLCFWAFLGGLLHTVFYYILPVNWHLWLSNLLELIILNIALMIILSYKAKFQGKWIAALWTVIGIGLVVQGGWTFYEYLYPQKENSIHAFVLPPYVELKATEDAPGFLKDMEGKFQMITSSSEESE